MLSNIFKNILLLATSILLFFCVSEIVLRFTDFQPRQYVEQPYSQWMNHRMGKRDFIYKGQEVIEFITKGHWNSEAFYDREYDFSHKVPDTFRIIVLGDSYVEALQVPLDKTFHKLLESRLNRESKPPNKNFEVISMGISGYGQVKEYELLETRGIKYKPDLVMVEFNSVNDIADNYPPLKEKDAKRFPKSKRKYSREQINKKLIFLNSSLLNHLIAERIADFYIYLDLYQLDYFPLTWLPFTKTTIPEIEKAWEITKEAMLKMRDLSEENNAKFLVFSNYSRVSIQEFSWREKWRYVDFNRYEFDFDKPYRMIKGFCEENRIPIVDLSKTMRDYRNKHGRNSLGWRFEGHWNEKAHQLASDVLFSYLKNSDLLNNSKTENDVSRQ